MSSPSSRRGIKRIEVLVILGVIGLLLCLLIPAVMNAREAARRTSCIGTMKMIGVALHTYDSAHHSFPPSMIERPKGHLLTATGPIPGTDNTHGNGADFSWRVLIFPYQDGDAWYQRLDVANGFPYDGNSDRKMIAAIPTRKRFSDVRGPLQLCQSFDGSIWSGAPEYPTQRAAISNYVALGATHLASLYRTETQPIGGTSHPNGVIYPGSKATLNDITDGLSQTVVVCETREQSYAAWIDGTTAAVVGLAEQSRPAFELGKGETYYSPTSTVRTTVNWGSDDPDDGQCYLPVGNHSGRRPWIHGPSSFHPGLVNHGLGDGSVRSVSEDIDPTIYMHLITRSGGEPVNEFFNL